jgi:transposase
VATELGGTQITSLMEVLPGIAQVLRSPVADAIVNLIRAACRVREFDLADADEMLNYAVRRNLMAAEERERVLAEARAFVQKRAERAAERDKPKAKVVVAKQPKPKPKVVAIKPAKPLHHIAHQHHAKAKPPVKPMMAAKTHPKPAKKKK